MEHTTDTPIQTSPATSLDILSALQRTLNGQIHNATNHGLILISANLVKESIDALRVSNLKTFSTLRDYLRDGESLTPTEFTILELLVAAGGEAVAYDELNQRAGIESGCDGGGHEITMGTQAAASHEVTRTIRDCDAAQAWICVVGEVM